MSGGWHWSTDTSPTSSIDGSLRGDARRYRGGAYLQYDCCEGLFRCRCQAYTASAFCIPARITAECRSAEGETWGTRFVLSDLMAMAMPCLWMIRKNLTWHSRTFCKVCRNSNTVASGRPEGASVTEDVRYPRTR